MELYFCGFHFLIFFTTKATKAFFWRMEDDVWRMFLALQRRFAFKRILLDLREVFSRGFWGFSRFFLNTKTVNGIIFLWILLSIFLHKDTTATYYSC